MTLDCERWTLTHSSGWADVLVELGLALVLALALALWARAGGDAGIERSGAVAAGGRRTVWDATVSLTTAEVEPEVDVDA